MDCNGGLNPLQQDFNDGINVGPLEAMFTKVGDVSENLQLLIVCMSLDKEWHANGL